MNRSFLFPCWNSYLRRLLPKAWCWGRFSHLDLPSSCDFQQHPKSPLETRAQSLHCLPGWWCFGFFLISFSCLQFTWTIMLINGPFSTPIRQTYGMWSNKWQSSPTSFIPSLAFMSCRRGISSSWFHHGWMIFSIRSRAKVKDRDTRILCTLYYKWLTCK